MRILAVDGGNTKLKIGLLEENLRSCVETREVTFDSFEEQIKKLCHKNKISECNLALTSVVQATKDFVMHFAEINSLISNFHYVTAKENKVLKLNYNAQKLGSDRLAAAIAARNLTDHDEIIIVDSGTATKVDMVKGDTFLGGFILPGIGIKAQALFEKTDKLPETDVYNIDYSHCPTETHQAIESGLIIDSLGGIEKAIRVCKETLPSATIIATGGGWDILKQFSDIKGIVTKPNLALLGAGISMAKSI